MAADNLSCNERVRLHSGLSSELRSPADETINTPLFEPDLGGVENDLRIAQAATEKLNLHININRYLDRRAGGPRRVFDRENDIIGLLKELADEAQAG